MSGVKPPKAGPGRPRKPQAPRSDAQVHLAAVIVAREEERDEAAEAYSAGNTVAAELRLLSTELSVSTAWAAYLRSEGNHTHALKYAEDRTKVANRISALREILLADKLDQLDAQNARESEVSRLVAVDLANADDDEVEP